MIDLKGLFTVKAKGRVYRYAWRGGPRMETDPADSAAFAAEFARHHADRKGGDQTKLSGLCAMFRASDAWNGRGRKPISAKTRASWTTWLDRIQDEFGELKVEQFDRAPMRRFIVKWRDKYAATPRAADMGVQVLSRLLSFGVAEGKLLNNICKDGGIESIYEADRSGFIWTEVELAELEKTAAPEIVQAARLAALTGLRQGDLLRLSWSHIQAHSIEIATGKSRRRKTTLVPIYGELRTYLDTLTKRATTVLVNTEGRPWRTGFGSSWGKACDKAGIEELHFHDLRGTAATRFYLGGLSIREIAEIMTWSEDYVEGLINRYVKKDELLKDRIRRLDENALRTGTVKPESKPSAQT
jgi:integrase